MAKRLSQETWKQRAGAVSDFYRRRGRMPSFSELGEAIGLKSKFAVSKAVDALSLMGAVRKDPTTGRLVPGTIGKTLRALGTVEAGFPSPAEEELGDVISLDDLLLTNRQASFLLKVSGDSMSGAGIIAGDMVIVDRSRTPKNGDIVIAQVDGEWTMKTLRKTTGGVILMPANPNYKPIKPKTDLTIAGVVTAVVRKYG